MTEPVPIVTGTTPAGAADERSAARAVQQMFDSIAPRYDLLNHVLSASVDRLWWWQTARKFRTILTDPNGYKLDFESPTDVPEETVYSDEMESSTPTQK